MHIDIGLSIAHQQSSVELRKPQRSWRLSLAPSVAVICLLIQCVGCLNAPPDELFQESMVDYRNHVWARRAYNLRYGKCEREYSDHFRQGFIDGYCDLCNGGDGYVPAVPPEDYWSGQYQSPEGAKCVNTWFKSFPLGVKAAREDGAGSFQKVYTSKMVQAAIVQDQADHVLPDDVPVVTPERESTAALPDNPFANDPSFDASSVQQRTANSGPISNSDQSTTNQ